MLAMQSKSVVIFFCAVMALALPSAFATTTCDVRASVPDSARTFAETGDQQSWREFHSIQDIPSLDSDSGDSAQFWKDETGASFAYTVESGEDFSTYTRYCFDRAGLLRRVGFEVRTAWGWGYRLEGTVVKGILRENSSTFFSTDNEKTISRPSGADDVPDALKPTLYMAVKKLPFARLLAPSQPSGAK